MNELRANPQNFRADYAIIIWNTNNFIVKALSNF